MNGKGASVALGVVKSTSICRAIQQRMFSASLKRQKTAVIPVFEKTSSSELDDALALVREKVIVPAYLSASQRNMIYRPRYKKLLENETMVANIAGERIRLTHVDSMTELPNTRTTFHKLLSLMVEKGDFNNMPKLLEGLHKANSAIMQDRKALRSLIGSIRRADRLDILIECLRRSSDTGLTLRTPELAEQAMRVTYLKAFYAEWDVNHTKKALHLAEMLLDLMEDPKHSYTRAIRGGTNDPRASPDIIAIPLILAATRASKHLDGKDEEGKVEQYAERLLANWINIKPARPGATTLQMLARKNRWLADTMYILHSTTAALSVLNSSSDIAIRLKENSLKLKEEAKSVDMEIGSSDWGKEMLRQGPRMYQTVYSTEAS
ncbi:uncharacterized protein BP5553_00914 [Venustampulla echinocandica]|uniref:Uncharacterized protein n=1 Tax=Venustampulla echinocandica TaxID=2656787 RepID=A0A370TZI5_9HELO|nr:uncharacterized protein BP5553_00914 [Venustampulla echinocandica]RDL40935.1 hypothetical protein BP5553_00914 [Venustampulla echinocandica]